MSYKSSEFKDLLFFIELFFNNKSLVFQAKDLNGLLTQNLWLF